MNYKDQKEKLVEKRCPYCGSKEMVTTAEWINSNDLRKIDKNFVEINIVLECLACGKISKDKYLLKINNNKIF